MASSEPKKAYYVVESIKGQTTWLIFARNGQEARERFHEGNPIDSSHPQS